MTSEESGLAAPAHTPGPWRTFQDRPNPWWIVRGERRAVAEVEVAGQALVWNDPKHEWVTRANAHLIAAAPDLLALVKQYALECLE